ncbi:hypothetical protein P879_11577 [Paragonimus westermani]|uniref:Uncharacterized protein n=1 Tax=Paragonimus westermani TaxID=34504 RepID=A0A8T0DAB7_9TREM|nr:hypothetical protein P879_11577 [Paragonimus westermani]
MNATDIDACPLSKEFRLQVPIGIDGISCATFLPDASPQQLVLGTTGGRVRIYDVNNLTQSCVYQRKWHKSVRCLSLLPTTHQLASASGQGGIKLHDLESGTKTWMRLKAHDNSPISSLLTTSPVQLITGDEAGIVKVSYCYTLQAPDCEWKLERHSQLLSTFMFRDFLSQPLCEEALYWSFILGSNNNFTVLSRSFQTDRA